MRKHNYNNRRYRESFDNLTQADIYLGRAEEILQRRKQSKTKTLMMRKKYYIKQNIYQKYYNFSICINFETIQTTH